jgi:tetrathionate reductase subunit B
MHRPETQELLAKAQVWAPDFVSAARPRVYYLNLPKRFIAGTLYEPVEEEVMIGATATLTAARTRWS